jgi:hypothetical protein
MNLKKYIARWNERRKIGRNAYPSAQEGRSLSAELGRASWAEQLSHRCHKKQPWMVSDLLLAIREVDEVNHLQE